MIGPSFQLPSVWSVKSIFPVSYIAGIDIGNQGRLIMLSGAGHKSLILDTYTGHKSLILDTSHKYWTLVTYTRHQSQILDTSHLY